MPLDEVRHQLIEASRALRAAEAQDCHAAREAEHLPRLLAGTLGEVAAHGQSGHDGRGVRGEIFLRRFKGHHDRIRFFGKQLIRDTRICILLMHGSRNTELLCRPNDRSRSIAACTDRKVRLKFLHNRLDD